MSFVNQDISQSANNIDGCYSAHWVHEGVVDCGLSTTCTRPFHEGVVDCGLSKGSTGPFHEGVVDCGFSEKPEPSTRGGVLQSDLHINVV